MRSRLLAVLLVLPLCSVVACKKKKDDAQSSSASAKDDDGDKKKKKEKADEDEPADDEGSTAKKKKKGSKGCKAPEGGHVNADLTIPEGCSLELDDNLTVEEGATLTIEPGAKLSFAPNTYLWIDHGKLVAKGSEDQPIVFTSKNSSPSKGDWDGIVFADKTMAGTVLDHVVVEYAGHATHGAGAVTLHGSVPAGRVAVTSSKIRHNATAGVNAESVGSTFAKLEGNTFEDNDKTSLKLHASVLGSIGKNTFGEPIKVHGEVKKTATWPKSDAPIQIVDDVTIGGADEAAILTLPDDAVVKFSPGKYLWIGADHGGGLVAKGVTFTSANASPAEGDWEGLILDDKVTQTKITDCVIEYAGHGTHGKGGITFHGKTAKETKGVKIEGCTFKHVQHGAFHSSDHDCGAFAGGNKVEGGAICTKE